MAKKFNCNASNYTDRRQSSWNKLKCCIFIHVLYFSILGLHVTSQMFPHLGIRHTGVHPWVKFTCWYAIAIELLEISMDFSENERVPMIDELCSKNSSIIRVLQKPQWPRYLEKIGRVGVDPVTIPDEQFYSNCLPPIKATDLLS